MQRYEVLWAVHSFSLKWRALQRRREVRHAAFQAALAAAADEERAAIQECLDALATAQTFEVHPLTSSHAWLPCFLHVPCSQNKPLGGRLGLHCNEAL